MVNKIVLFFFPIIVLFILTSFFANSVLACIGQGSPCVATGELCCCGGCVGNSCQGACPTSSFFGQISPPPGIANYAGGGVQGIVLFANNILKLVIVGGGILTFLNILLAGMAFISAGGDPKKIEQASTKIWQSILGLVIIAGSFVIAALIGWILFGDATAILSPKISGPGP